MRRTLQQSEQDHGEANTTIRFAVERKRELLEREKARARQGNGRR
ncbi:MAG: hypothetical protein WEB57_13775 [Pseudohongiellaceae bacterium]